jgi:hypothetical protein
LDSKDIGFAVYGAHVFVANSARLTPVIQKNTTHIRSTASTNNWRIGTPSHDHILGSFLIYAKWLFFFGDLLFVDYYLVAINFTK